LTGGETTVTVDSVLKTDVFETGTAPGSSANTITDSTKNWATDQWKNFYVRITSGAKTHSISLITANTATQLTFSTLESDPSSPTYDIRMPKFPASGPLMLNGN